MDTRVFFPANGAASWGPRRVAMMAIADPSGRHPPDSSAVVVGASACPRCGSTCAGRQPDELGRRVHCCPQRARITDP